MFFWIKDARSVVIPFSFLLFLPSSTDRLSWELVCSYFPLGEDSSSSVFVATYGSLCTESFSWLQCHFTNGRKEGWPTAECTLLLCQLCSFHLGSMILWIPSGEVSILRYTLSGMTWHLCSHKIVLKRWTQRPCYQDTCFFILFWSLLWNGMVKKFYSKSRENILELASFFLQNSAALRPNYSKTSCNENILKSSALAWLYQILGKTPKW